LKAVVKKKPLGSIKHTLRGYSHATSKVKYPRLLRFGFWDFKFAASKNIFYFGDVGGLK